MSIPSSAIFAVLFLSLALPPMARAAEPSLQSDIMKASQAHVGSARAAAEFQKSQSQLAAESLIKTIQTDAAASQAIEPAAGVSLFDQVPKAVPQQAFTVQNELIAPPAKVAAPVSAVSAPISRILPSYNQ